MTEVAQVGHPGVSRRVLTDARGADRALRVSWHGPAGAAGLVVLSLWRGEVCVGTFRLLPADIPELVALLTTGLPRA